MQCLFPDASTVPGLGGDTPVTLLTLREQTVIGLSPCAVGFRFFADALYEVTFDCGRDVAALAAFRERLGPPSERSEAGVFWHGERTIVSLNPTARSFGFASRARLPQVHAALLRAVATRGAPSKGW